MNTNTQARPTLKIPEQKPFKVSEHAAEPKPAPAVQPREDGWAPMDTAPQEADAVFLIRACANGKPIRGTDTLVAYRRSRKRVGGEWIPSFTIIDYRLQIKLGFRPTEWRPAPKEQLEHSTWDDAIAQAAADAKARHA